jgi:hypothetical protein
VTGEDKGNPHICSPCHVCDKMSLGCLLLVNHSMRDSAQVTAPGAIISMITAVSTRPNKNSQPMGYQDRLALDYLSKMKIAVMVRQLDLGHILWCGRVVRCGPHPQCAR